MPITVNGESYEIESGTLVKLRIHHQQLIFRLSPKDLDKLENVKFVSDQLELSSEVNWKYKLTLSDKTTETRLQAKPLDIEITLPETSFLDWLKSHEIEWTYQQTNPPLEILIEKDLKPR